MKWLKELLFGNRPASSQSEASTINTMAPIPSHLPISTSDLASFVPISVPPTFGWRVSENGNDTTIVHGRRVSIYSSGNSWKFAVADPEDRSEPYFSDAYNTKEIARFEAMAFVNWTASQYQSKREIREQTLSAALPSMLEKALADYERIKQSVDRQTANPKLSSLTNLLERINSKKNGTGRLYVEIYAENKVQPDIAKAKVLWENYTDLQKRVETAIAKCNQDKEST